MKKSLTILGIETSCDETAAAVLKIENYKLKILSNIVASQVKLHAKYGGVYPMLAKREHQRNLPVVLKKALKKAGSPAINLIAVTAGPGLEPCLWEGVNFAQNLAKKLKAPIIPINHIEAHILVNFVDLNSKFKSQNAKLQSKIQNLFPAVSLVVSGGHTQLILIKDIGKYKILGETRDDAAGECFDKTARILGLGYPGGPEIAKQAQLFSKRNRALSLKLPRPMMNQKNYDFSFSGLKTAVLYNYKNRPPKVRKSKQYIQAMCHEIQQAVIDVLIKKTILATKNFKAKTIILGGGVAANQELRRQFAEKIKKETRALNKLSARPSTKIFSAPVPKLLIPVAKYSTDNAAMIAITGYFHQREKTKKYKKIKANANLRIG